MIVIVVDGGTNVNNVVVDCREREGRSSAVRNERLDLGGGGAADSLDSALFGLTGARHTRHSSPLVLGVDSSGVHPCCSCSACLSVCFMLRVCVMLRVYVSLLVFVYTYAYRCV